MNAKKLKIIIIPVVSLLFFLVLHEAANYLSNSIPYVTNYRLFLFAVAVENFSGILIYISIIAIIFAVPIGVYVSSKSIKKSVAWFAFVFLLLFMVSGLLVLLRQGPVHERFCELRGGKLIWGGWAVTCELKAKDAGKKCFYDDECVKNNCVYSTSFTFDPKNEQAIKNGGYCDDYIRDNDGVIQWHRSRCNADKGMPVCDPKFDEGIIESAYIS